MELGQRIKEARLAAGVSQRQLCGDTITRNMLSRIEHGAVRPSMTTLRFLAERLGKPVSYFLDETTVTSPNLQVMTQARQCYRRGDSAGVLAKLEEYKAPDDTFDDEKLLLQAKCLLAMAAEALLQEKFPYAVELLYKAEQAGKQSAYYGPELERERLLLLAQTGEKIDLPENDRELLLRAKWAFIEGDINRCTQYLDAAENRTAPHWQLLRGESYFSQQDYENAAVCYLAAEQFYPKQVWPKLEVCYQMLENYKMAYEYACKQREK